MIDELPLSDELDRKAIEALIRIADEQSRSLMSEREARLAIRAVFETNQIQILNTSTGEWREPVVCESGEDALKKAAQFVRGALLKGAKKL